MAEVKTLVIDKMEPLLINLPSLQIHFAKTYNIPKWLAPALYRLAQRATPLGEEDVGLVGLPDSLKICALREKLKRCKKCGAGIYSRDIGLSDIGSAFDIHDSDLPSSVLGFEKNCTCSKADEGRNPGATVSAFAGIFGPSQSSSFPNTAPASRPFSFAPQSFSLGRSFNFNNLDRLHNLRTSFRRR